MQPKRSRLFLALSLQQQVSRSAEDALFRKLGELIGRPVDELPYTPTFFPLLLSRANGPAELLKEALAHRRTGEVKDYRAWLAEALSDFEANGRIPIGRKREVEKIESAIRRKLAGVMPSVEIKTTVADAVASPVPGVEVDLTKPAEAAWGWLVSQIPGKRHRKLLTRAVVADAEYIALDRRVSTVWNGAGLGP